MSVPTAPSVVTRVRVWRTLSPLVRPFVTAVRTATRIDVVLVEAIDDAGRSGWGEAAVSWRVTGESPRSVTAVIDEALAPVVLGSTPEAGIAVLGSAVWGNAAARSALGCALVDLMAHRDGKRVADALSGVDGVGGVRRIRTDMTLSAGAVEVVAEAARIEAEAGFGVLKVKADAAMDLVEVLSAVRAEVGDAVGLRVDANQAWDADEAVRRIRACEDAGLAVDLIEQPVRADDLDALAEVTAAVETPIMADESVRTARDVIEIGRRHAADLVNIKLAKTGGLVEAWAAADAARAAGLGIVVGCMMESQVGVTASVHLATALAPDTVHDLDAARWFAQSPVVGGATGTGEWIELAPASGLGIDGLADPARSELLLDVAEGVR